MKDKHLYKDSPSNTQETQKIEQVSHIVTQKDDQYFPATPEQDKNQECFYKNFDKFNLMKFDDGCNGPEYEQPDQSEQSDNSYQSEQSNLFKDDFNLKEIEERKNRSAGDDKIISNNDSDPLTKLKKHFKLNGRSYSIASHLNKKEVEELLSRHTLKKIASELGIGVTLQNLRDKIFNEFSIRISDINSENRKKNTNLIEEQRTKEELIDRFDPAINPELKKRIAKLELSENERTRAKNLLSTGLCDEISLALKNKNIKFTLLEIGALVGISKHVFQSERGFFLNRKKLNTASEDSNIVIAFDRSNIPSDAQDLIDKLNQHAGSEKFTLLFQDNDYDNLRNIFKKNKIKIKDVQLAGLLGIPHGNFKNHKKKRNKKSQPNEELENTIALHDEIILNKSNPLIKLKNRKKNTNLIKEERYKEDLMRFFEPAIDLGLNKKIADLESIQHERTRANNLFSSKLYEEIAHALEAQNINFLPVEIGKLVGVSTKAFNNAKRYFKDKLKKAKEGSKILADLDSINLTNLPTEAQKLIDEINPHQQSEKLRWLFEGGCYELFIYIFNNNGIKIKDVQLAGLLGIPHGNFKNHKNEYKKQSQLNISKRQGTDEIHEDEVDVCENNKKIFTEKSLSKASYEDNVKDKNVFFNSQNLGFSNEIFSLGKIPGGGPNPYTFFQNSSNNFLTTQLIFQNANTSLNKDPTSDNTGKRWFKKT